MKQWIQRVLDGEIPRDALSCAEAAELDRCERALAGVVEALPQDDGVDVAPAVLRRIAMLEEQRAGRVAEDRPVPTGAVVARGATTADAGRAGLAGVLRRLDAWLWRPRTLEVRFRPAVAMAAAAIAVLAVGTGRALLDAPSASAPPLAETPATPRVFVHFRLDAAGAAEVRLAGDFTGWEPAYALQESAPGVWSVVVPLEPGVHDYAFVVDGERWVADPLAPHVDDGFGGQNSRLAVMLPGDGRSS
ncbi:MAG TPA: glycogen-binding domain-containing protein [Longimicrobiales bacterium]